MKTKTICILSICFMFHMAFSQCTVEQDIFWVGWGDNPSIGRIDTETGINTNVFAEPGQAFDGITMGRGYYFCTYSGQIGQFNGEIRRFNRYGDLNPLTIVSGLDFPGHPIVDWKNFYIYWTENDGAPMGHPEHGGRVCRAKLKWPLPLDIEPLITENTGRPQGIDLDPTGQYLYYSDTKLGEIYKYNIETAELELIHTGLFKPYCLDVNGDEMFWVESYFDLEEWRSKAAVWKSNLDGSNKIRLAPAEGKWLDSAYGITVISDRVYWSGGNNVWWVDRNGGDIHHLYQTDHWAIAGITNEPPIIRANADPIKMWPPNHKYRTFTLSDLNVSVSGHCNGQDIPVIISEVSSDEPEDETGNGDGKTFDDMVIAADGKSVRLRAERQGKGNGRVYKVYFSGTDVTQHYTLASCQVTVPHDKHDTAIDDGPVYWEPDGLSKSLPGTVEKRAQPAGYELHQNYPNPFNPITEITYTLPEAVHASLKIYNTTGRQIRELVSGHRSAGAHTVTWDATDDTGNHVPSGLYIYLLRAGSVTIRKKMTLMK